MSPKQPGGTACPECGAIVREMMSAAGRDAARLREQWLSKGEDLAEARDRLIRLFGEDPAAASEWVQANYRQASEARRRRAEHEAATGHSVLRDGWRALLGQS